MPESRKSKIAKEWEHRALRQHAESLGESYINTPDTGGNYRARAVFDAIFVRGSEMASIWECKARWLSEKAIEQYGGEILISKKKIDNCCTISGLAQAPFNLMFISIPLKCYWTFLVSKAGGEIILPITYEERETQYSTEGGTKTETVALIDLKHGNKEDIQCIN